MHRIHISIATSHAHGNYDNTPTEFNVALVGNAPDLPLEEFHTILCLRLAPEVAIGRGFLVFWLAERKRNCNRAWTAIKFDFYYVCDVFRVEAALLCAVCLHKE